MAQRLGLAGVLPERMGSVALPSGVKLSCPRCGEAAADEGQCLVAVEAVPDPGSKTGMSARIAVDCRICGTDGRPPAVAR